MVGVEAEVHGGARGHILVGEEHGGRVVEEGHGDDGSDGRGADDGCARGKDLAS